MWGGGFVLLQAPLLLLVRVCISGRLLLNQQYPEYRCRDESVTRGKVVWLVLATYLRGG